MGSRNAAKLRTAAAHWTKQSEQPVAARTRWWHIPAIVRHVNRIYCGEPVEGRAAGDIALLRGRLNGRTFDSAVSIGCGTGAKEIALLRAGLVSRFELYEISETRVREGKEMSLKYGVQDRIDWHTEALDFATDERHATFDLVYWSDALHHMLDVDAAVSWSRRLLRPDGYLYINDFVGPDRMQWSDEALAIGSRVLQLLPPRLLRRADGRRGRLPRVVSRPDPEALAADDPTECADSSDILPAIQRHFDDPWIKLTGGTIYHGALNNVIANFTEQDERLLETLLLLDEVCAMAGHSHYAVVLAAANPPD